jgi:hypothetical protein
LTPPPICIASISRPCLAKIPASLPIGMGLELTVTEPKATRIFSLGCASTEPRASRTAPSASKSVTVVGGRFDLRFGRVREFIMIQSQVVSQVSAPNLYFRRCRPYHPLQVEHDRHFVIGFIPRRQFLSRKGLVLSALDRRRKTRYDLRSS